MGRKRSDTEKPETPPVTETDNLDEAETPQREMPANKTDAVRTALAEGINSPTEISEFAKREFGLDITPAYVSTIKGTLKKEKKGKGKRGPGRTKEGRGERAIQPAARTTAG